MEDENSKRKRRRRKKKKSKSLFVKTLGFESKNKDNSVSLLKKYNVTNCIKPFIAGTRASSPRQNIKDSNPKGNTSKKRKVKSKNRVFINDVDTLRLSKHSSGSNCLKYSETSSLNPEAVDAKLNTSVETFPDKMSNTPTKRVSFKEKLQKKLESGRFRWINEKLYTTNSLSAFKMFKSEPELFDVYHNGFSSQIQKWPVNPVDTMIDWIKERSPQLIIADMGCGEAKISQSVPNKVFSFDFVAVNSFVTECDMAKVPLADGSVDVVIFCLSLMGTNLNEFLKEAHRILKSNGILKIAEVVSRFESLGSFETTVSCLGFKLLIKDTTNKMFVQFQFKKLSKKPDKTKTVTVSLKPCLYKRR
ncbi:ribosomal RNA-processing protein 8-like [Dendronephthya gigantea]|uniref:ribosomal RNA-processing protein 8-like n=1 Tax=Dendronephthya gigantea TaxID=151771 RepID=UPI001068D908|nr:ribosomal RNA-processing protein 8-like [Dendronephthya gigantea]